MNRRPRRTAKEIANIQSRGGWFFVALIAIGLALILYFKFAIGDKSTETFQMLVGNPELQLPRSVTEQDASASGAPVENRQPTAKSSAVRTDMGTSKPSLPTRIQNRESGRNGSP